MKRLSRMIQSNWGPALALLVLGLLPFLGYLTSGDILFASDQIGSPAWKYVFEALRRGEIPLWNPYALAGVPSYDALVGDASYPLFLLLGLLFPVEKVVGYNFVLHVLIAGFTAYLLLRRYFRLDKLVAVGLAAAYMLNTNFISHIYSGHTGKFFIMSWLPLALHFLLRSLDRNSRPRHLLGLCLLIFWFVLTSHLQFTYYVLMGFFLYWAFITYRLVRKRNWGHVGLVGAKFWLPILLGIGLAFPLFHAPVKYNELFSVRGEAAKKTFEHAASWSLHPEEALSLVVPEFTGLNQHYWGRNPFKLNSEYPGLALLMLGITGLAFCRRRPWFWLWGAVGLLSILYGLGANTPLFRLFYEVIPGVKNFRAPGMILFWLAAALLLLAAATLRWALEEEGAEKDGNRDKRHKLFLRIGFAAAGLLGLMGLLGGGVYSIYNGLIDASRIPNFQNQAQNYGEFSKGALKNAVLLALLVWGFWKWQLKAKEPRFFGALLLLVVAADLYFVNRHFITTYEFSRFYPQEPAVELLKGEKEDFRVFGMPGSYDRGFMQYHQIETVEGFMDQEYRVYRAYRGGDYQGNPNFMEGLRQNPDGSVSGSRFLDLLNVRYLAFRLPEDGVLRLVPNASALPRAYFVTDWTSEKDSLVLERMKDPAFDPRRTAFLSSATPARLAPTGSGAAFLLSDSAAASPGAAAPPAAEFRKVRRSVNHLEYQVRNSAAGLAVFSELFIPYWKVRVDGRETPVLRVNYAFRGVELEPGEHTVHFHYHSPYLLQGLYVSLGSLVVLLAGLFLYRRFEGRLQGPA